ncbi:MAG: type IV toxin-antitoxin system AbiEi family antitoxin [Acidimicrobiales bacterium]
MYRLAGVPWSWEADLLAFCWAQYPNGLASHQSAARLWGVSGFNGRVTHVIVPMYTRRKRNKAGFKLHESRKLPPSDRCVLDGIPVTSPARTVVDLAVYGDQSDVDHAMESMQRMGHCTYDELESTVLRLAGPGRRGSTKLKRALARQGGRERFIDSKSNIKLRSRLVEAGLAEPAMEWPVTAEGSSYYLDLAYPRQKVAIECVSKSFHLREASYDSDTRRRNAILNEGWIMLEFTWHQIHEVPDECVATVAAALRKRIHYL